MEDGAISDTAICSFAVNPPAKVGEKVVFDVTCDAVSATELYLIAFQAGDDDHCTVEATGTLKTR